MDGFIDMDKNYHPVVAMYLASILKSLLDIIYQPDLIYLISKSDFIFIIIILKFPSPWAFTSV